MTPKHFLMAVLCLVGFTSVSCDREVPGDATFIEGGWEIQTVTVDKVVYADWYGNTYVRDSLYTREYKPGEEAWLFRNNYITEWHYSNEEGDWNSTYCDCYQKYVVEGEDDNLEIVVTSGSIIPGHEEYTSISRYKVEKITNKHMILSTVSKFYISDLESTVNVQQEYTFKRQDSLLKYILSRSGL